VRVFKGGDWPMSVWQQGARRKEKATLGDVQWVRVCEG